MKLDQSKKYEGWGYTIEFRNSALSDARVPIWKSVEINFKGEPLIEVDEPVVQAWLDAGHITPVKETKIVRVEGCVIVSRLDWYQVISCNGTREDIPSGATAKPVTLEFEVEA